MGSSREKKHYEQLLVREEQLRPLAARADKIVNWQTAQESKLVSASVVIAGDYFKTVIAGLKSLIGGTLNSQESLLDRARREALIRLKEKAKKMGASEIVGLRLEATSLDQAGVEIHAYGTAIRHSR